MAIIIPTTGVGDATPTVATENIGGAHYQGLKLYTGTTGTATVWDGAVTVSSLTTGSVVVRNLTTGSVSAIVANWPAVQTVTGNINVLNFPTTQAVSGDVNILNWTTATIVTTGALMVGQLTTARSITTGSVMAGLLTTAFYVTSGNINVGNIVNVTGTLGATFATTAFQVTTGNINIGNIVNVTGTLGATFATTAFQVTTGNINIGNVVNVTGTLGATFATTAFQVTTGDMSVQVRSITTGNVSADVRSITTGTVMVSQITTARSLTAGELVLGKVGGITTSLTISPTLSVGTTYATGDYVGVNATPMAFAGAARVAGGSGVILGGVLVDGSLQSAASELWLFDTAPTPTTDNAAFSLSAADAAKVIGVIPFAAYYATTGNSVSPMANQNIPFKCAAGSTAFYALDVSRGTPVYVTTALSFRLFVSQD